MTFSSILLLISVMVLIWLLVKPVGSYIAAISDDNTHPTLIRFETKLFKCLCINTAEMNWFQYAIAIIIFKGLGVLFLFVIQRIQAWLPFNPMHFANVAPDSAFNTAISFLTNTNWQGYAGETTMSYATQAFGLTVQNFISAAIGIAVVLVLIRGFARHVTDKIGNFWVDLTRIVLYLLLPLSFMFAVFLMSQGAIQNWQSYVNAYTLDTTTYQTPKLDDNGQAVQDTNGETVFATQTLNTQTIPMGPVASQEAIKILGTNGGGFFNANSAHAFENPTPLSNFFQIISILLISAALCFTFGKMVGDTRQGWAILTAMSVLLIIAAIGTNYFEQQINPKLSNTLIDQKPSALQCGGNMEGKEVRFGISASTLFATVTTGASCGAVNSMHDSYSPLGGMIPMWLMQLGEVVFGGVGSGLYGMLIFAILSVFIAGLMIGRTPEYLGKKIEAFEMKMTSIVILLPPFLVLVGTAIAVLATSGKAGILNPGPHGFSEILYALSSTANNNGSAFAGLSANTPFYNTLLGIVMWFGRFGCMIPVLAIAGSLAAKKRLEVTAGTLPTHGPLFIVLLMGVVLVVGALIFVPALILGPVVEQLMLY